MLKRVRKNRNEILSFDKWFAMQLPIQPANPYATVDLKIANQVKAEAERAYKAGVKNALLAIDKDEQKRGALVEILARVYSEGYLFDGTECLAEYAEEIEQLFETEGDVSE